jgi:uncharacterized LabA/DUF88 family protein
MVLNIAPKRRATTEPEPVLTEASVAPVDTSEPETTAPEPRRRTRRTTTTAKAETTPEPSPAPARPARSRTRRTAARQEAEPLAPAGDSAQPPSPETEVEIAARSDELASEAVPVDTEPSPESVVPLEETGAEGTRGSRRRGGRGGRGRGRRDRADERPAASAQLDDESAPSELAARLPEDDAATPVGLRPILRAIEQQARQVERLARITEDLARKAERPGANGAAPAPAVKAARVGVFVDTANIELATDRLRTRFDWGRVLKLLLKERQLVRAVAYSPIHDDPAVSIETQRFVEPFLDRGFKIVTKPFRRFQDGSIKANLDIELALDVVAMLDRLDVLVLVSGDGDFQRLVELAQSRGVRVEVAAVGASTASNLRHAADEYIDLGTRARELRA